MQSQTSTTRRRSPVGAIVTVLAVAGIGYAGWHQYQQSTAAASGPLTASGTIESRTVTIAAEVAGRVIEINAEEGQPVKAGTTVIHLDDATLQAQYAQAQAALDAAKANYDLLAAGPTQEQVRQAESALVIATANYSRTIDGSRQTDIAAAQAALKAASDSYNKIKAGPTDEDYASAKASLQNAEATLKQAQSLYDNAYRRDPAGIGGSPAATTLETATNNYNAAKSLYDKAVKGPDEAQLSISYQQVVAARANLDRAAKPARDFDIVQARAQMDSAQAQLDAIKAGTRVQQLNAAKAQVAAAESQVRAIEIQIKKTTLVAPIDGVILSRNIEQGELATLGAPLLVIGKLADLELTVYVPEEKVGYVHPGQQTILHVDAYPGRDFTVTVSRVADQAEFTPRNVQTVEGRKDTVYAVHLTLTNPDLALKPGMPADVIFGQ